uniref:Uncharacterized protein n=1 Tax=Oryza meridionalis TaxID=40149 RepID=A0A0E0CLC9_9ORYZ
MRAHGGTRETTVSRGRSLSGYRIDEAHGWGFSALTDALIVSFLNWCFLGGALQPRQITYVVLAAKLPQRTTDDRSTTPPMYWDGVASPSSSSHPVAPYSSSSVIGENLLFHELLVCSFRDSYLWRAMSSDTFLMITPFGPTGECLMMTTLMTRKGVRVAGPTLGLHELRMLPIEGHKQEEYCSFYRQEKFFDPTECVSRVSGRSQFHTSDIRVSAQARDN